MKDLKLMLIKFAIIPVLLTSLIKAITGRDLTLLNPKINAM